MYTNGNQAGKPIHAEMSKADDLRGEDIATNILCILENDGSYVCNVMPNAEGIKTRAATFYDLVLAHVRK
jgi:hypothetical protein